jgi:LysM repeat protein
MSCYVDKVIKIAKAEVNYKEKETNSQLDSASANAGDENFTKYARDLDKVTDFYNGRKQGCSWCDIFVDWCFYKAYGVTNARKLLCQPKKSAGAGCKYSMQYYQAKKQFYTSPVVGDQVFFANSSGEAGHTGLVVDVIGNYVYTVEGNTSTASGVVDNGGMVAQKRYSVKNTKILGYGRPKYDVQPTLTSTSTSATTSTTKKDYQCIHTVVKGDTLTELSEKYLGTSKRYREIMKLNGLKTDLIKIGKKLKIPNK